MVANTQTNLDLIEEYVRTFTSQEQAQVVLKVFYHRRGSRRP